jgi:peptidoglycan/xylan/chitin deacetylase (PgdA/CDA1 family)
VSGGAGYGGGALGGAGGAAGMAGAGGALDTAGAAGADVGPVTVVGVTKWKQDAKAAYSIIHDDLCDATRDSLFTDADRELTARGLRAGFGAIVGDCESRAIWDKVQVVKDHGHEILSHTWAHYDLVHGTDRSGELVSVDLNRELNQAASTLNQKLREQRTSYFIFPYDSFDDQLVSALAGAGYLAARAGERGLNEPVFVDAFRNKFDAWGASYIDHSGGGSSDPSVLARYVDAAIESGGWGNRELHSIGSAGWEIELATYQLHLDYLQGKVKSGELWVDNPSTVVRYRYAREACALPQGGASRLTPQAASAECSKWATELTVRVNIGVGFQTLHLKQGQRRASYARGLAGDFLVDVDPMAGPVLLGGS